MKLTLIAVLVVCACDPGVRVEFVVSDGSDSTAQLSTQIAGVLAQRHDMRAQALDSSCDLAAYHSNMSPTSWLDLCVDRKPQSVTFVLSEFITTEWGARGDSLGRELDDTLHTRFSGLVTRID